MPTPAAPALPPDPTHAAGLLTTLLTMSPTGVALLRPCYAAGTGAIEDFSWEHLNPAAQRMLRQPECPAPSLLALFPAAPPDGVFATCCQAYLTGQEQHCQASYPAGGPGGHLRLVAQRYEDLLVVNLAEPTDQSRAAVEEALRDSQLLGRQALAEAEAARADLTSVFEQAPAMICIFEGPRHVFQFANPPYQALVGQRQLVGLPIAEAMPELAGQPIFDLLDRVYRTGETYYASEMLVQLDHDNARPTKLEKRYYSFIYQARRDWQGAISGILVFAYEVTTQVQARLQVQELNEELAATNEELHASNEEYQEANTALSKAQYQLLELNHQLEARVQARTQQFTQQRNRLDRLFQEAPAAMCILNGPKLVFELVNPRYQALFPERELLGKPVLAALPEVVGSPFEALLLGVYRTGVTYEGREVVFEAPHPDTGQPHHRYFNFVYQARLDAAGQVDGILVFAFEVTEHVVARAHVQELNAALQLRNEELHASNQRLTRTNADLDTFVYAASHDLKAPIANIEGLLAVLRNYLPPAAQDPMVPRLLGMMEQSVTRFQQTVGHLTNISRLPLALPEAPVGPLDLPQALEDVRLDLLPLLTSTHAELQVALEPCPDVRFAAKDLRSVLFNLLSNAVKYRAPSRPPVVQLRAQCAATHLTLEVQDNGLGLTEPQQGELFTMFRRLHTHVEGSGVGLYLIKRLVENAGGTIAVRSQPDVGSTFTVTLPRA